MSAHIIKYSIDGTAEDGGHPRLVEFVAGLQHFMGALLAQDRSVSGSSRPTHQYRVINLSHSSPALVVIEASPTDPNAVGSDRIFSATSQLLRDVQLGTLCTKAETPVLNHLRSLAAPIGTNVREMTITIDDVVIQIGQDFRSNINSIMRQENSWPGFCRGVLEFLNIHDANRIIKIYPDVGPRSIKCVVPEALMEKAISAVGEYVEVSGMMLAKSASKYPYQIHMQDLRVLSPESNAPNLMDLFGISPDLDRDWA